MREGAGTDVLFKLAFHAERIVLLDIVSPRSQVIDQSREGIQGLWWERAFLRDLIALKYEVDPNNPDESDDAQLRFIHIAFDRIVNYAKAVITPDTISWNPLFEVNRKDLDKDMTKPFHFRFKLDRASVRSD
ncbi:hypothetical protein FOXG_22575 [Fusarium oxysporum f. sp. lycopersici 4287]|uniref:Uncharacterized protein n=1 Tax=Fusarium oxysporum f. sp. lycopersici (strain 4287 / CBS 123668 / FGSC 9935 / NRRL 34936) TaxID=426428 RepID=A0A0J9WA43_FUSO4|nr:hypothetical protein FOXG_22575 [Fusarium oxysporum f. sp. lycopersici 4287]KNB19465.1 hypothetical protein FOXG_22575 [Fusarium oxysporum f. sp. lycopersici 4287]